MKSILKSSAGRLTGWACLLFLAACARMSPVVSADFVDIPSEGIPEEWQYSFSPVPADSADILSERFNVVVVVRYSADCASRRIFLDVEECSLVDETPDSTRVEIALFDHNGKPRGIGNYGIYEIADTIRRSIRYPDGYTVAVSSPLPKDATAGINSIGVILSADREADLNIFNLKKKL